LATIAATKVGAACRPPIISHRAALCRAAPRVDERPLGAYDLAHFERRPPLTLLTVLITVAILATILTLVMGLWTMVYGAEDGPFDSEHWMTYRVILQVVTVLALGATYFVSR